MIEINDEVLRDFLESLGNSPDEVASNLASKGIKGSRSVSVSCPVTNVVKKYFETDNVSTGLSLCSVNVLTDYEGPSAQVELPYSVQVFVFRFDNGEFPELVEEEQ